MHTDVISPGRERGILAVLAAVHHAEVIALRLGEPFGTLVLALAVTVIETSLILTLMLTAGDEARTIARERRARALGKA